MKLFPRKITLLVLQFYTVCLHLTGLLTEKAIGLEHVHYIQKKSNINNI